MQLRTGRRAGFVKLISYEDFLEDEILDFALLSVLLLISLGFSKCLLFLSSFKMPSLSSFFLSLRRTLSIGSPFLMRTSTIFFHLLYGDLEIILKSF